MESYFQSEWVVWHSKNPHHHHHHQWFSWVHPKSMSKTKNVNESNLCTCSTSPNESGWTAYTSYISRDQLKAGGMFYSVNEWSTCNMLSRSDTQEASEPYSSTKMLPRYRQHECGWTSYSDTIYSSMCHRQLAAAEASSSHHHRTMTIPHISDKVYHSIINQPTSQLHSLLLYLNYFHFTSNQCLSLESRLTLAVFHWMPFCQTCLCVSRRLSLHWIFAHAYGSLPM